MNSNSSGAKEGDATTHSELLAAVKSDVAALHENTIKVIKDVTASNRVWDAVKTVLPILLTTFLTFLIWNAQSKIQGKVDDNNRVLQARMALTQDFYKMKLNAYVDTCRVIADMSKSLDSYQNKEFNPDIGKQASDNVEAVGRLGTVYALFLSDDLKKDLGKLWGSGINRMSNNDYAMQEINTQILALEQRMRNDLRTEELGYLPSPPSQ